MKSLSKALPTVSLLLLSLAAAAQAKRPFIRSTISAAVGGRTLVAPQPPGTTRSGVTWYRSSNTLILVLTTWPSDDSNFTKYTRLSFSLANFKGRPGTYRLAGRPDSQAIYAPAGASDSDEAFTSDACATPAFTVVVNAFDPGRRHISGTFAGSLCTPLGKKTVPVSAGKFDCKYSDWDEMMNGTGK